MNGVDLEALTAFIVASKRATYIGDGAPAPASRSGSHDLAYEQGAFAYRDSYFGGTDFVGQEVVWSGGNPVWAMNYYGHVSRPDLIDARRAGLTIKGALSAMYAEGRFLGGYDWQGPHGHYIDTSQGDPSRFAGREHILVAGREAYALDYHGGLIKP